MPFPTDDRAWNDTLLYLLERRRPGERTLAPEPFVDELPFVRTYDQPKGDEEPHYAWVVVHKGMLEALDTAFLRQLPGWSVPVFANEVFVVFAREPEFAMTDLSDSNHVKSLFGQLPMDAAEAEAAAVPQPVEVEPEPEPEARLQPEAEEPPAAPPAPAPMPAARPAQAPSGALQRLRQEETQRLVGEYLGKVQGRRVLDLGCGLGRFAATLASAEVLGVDAAPDLIEDAREAHAGLPNFRFIAADPRKPLLGERPFDVTLVVDALAGPGIDATALLENAASLTRPGGLLVVSAENRDALNRRVARDSAGGGFTLAELTGMLRAVGFRPLRADGIVLPWTAGPGSEDEDVLEALRELGRLAGPAYAQSIMVLASRD
jgi:SAM-dependent methyltransferase